MSLTFDRRGAGRIGTRAIAYALLTSLSTAAYTLVDGIGVRQAGSILGFAAWLTVGDGVLTCAIVLLLKGRAALRVCSRNAVAGLAGGTMQVAAYWIIIWALALAPMAMVSALRETSVLFAALLSTFVLKEGFGVWRFVSTGLAALGLIATRAGQSGH